MKFSDSNASTFVMNDEQLKAFVFAHMGVTADGLDAFKKLAAYDKLAVGWYSLIQLGADPDLTDEERKLAMDQGAAYYDLLEKVKSANYFADK